MVSNYSLKEKLIQGAGAGLIATFPMTVFMRAAWKRLPRHEKQPLPPRQITKKVTREMGVNRRLNADQTTILTLFLHFMFGAVAGSLYAAVEDRIPAGSVTKGSLAGLAVWSGSYLGWIPALGILPPATEHPWRRNLLMIVAHLVWGSTLGLLARMFDLRRSYINLE